MRPSRPTPTATASAAFPVNLGGCAAAHFPKEKQVRIVPNPLTDSALLQVEGIEPGPLNLVCNGRFRKVLRQQTTQGTGFEFQRDELNPGLYFFQIDRNGERVGSGKLMVNTVKIGKLEIEKLGDAI